MYQMKPGHWIKAAVLLAGIVLLFLEGCLGDRRRSSLMDIPSEHFTFSCSVENLHGLLPEVRAALDRVALEYLQATGERIRVTSARRSLRHCAELMAAFDQQQLEGMYCRNGYPDYIRELVAARKDKGAALSTEEVYQILCRRQSGYISWHLVGGAVDLDRRVTNPELLQKLLRENNFAVFDEQEFSVPCFHATYRGLPKTIIRE